MAGVSNQRVLLKQYVPEGAPSEDDFEVVTETKPGLEVRSGSRDVLVKTLYLSCDPYMRERMKDVPSYTPPFKVGEPIEGFMVGKVVKSAHLDFKEGDLVTGTGKWEEYFLVEDAKNIQKIPPIEGVPLSYFVGVLGMPGLTAWYGFFEVAHPKPGETVFVSAAAGAVGQLVGQYAKLIGCYIVGSAGSREKVKLLKEVFKFDEAFNYKEEHDLEAKLRRLFPKGMDIYFENVGGKTLDAVLSVMNNFGRISVCGMISQYNKDPSKGDPLQNSIQILKKRLTMKGFIILDYMQDKNIMSKFYETVGSLLQQKKILYKEDVVEGLEKAPSALLGVLEGKNVGKMVVKVADP